MNSIKLTVSGQIMRSILSPSLLVCSISVCLLVTYLVKPIDYLNSYLDFSKSSKEAKLNIPNQNQAHKIYETKIESTAANNGRDSFVWDEEFQIWTVQRGGNATQGNESIQSCVWPGGTSGETQGVGCQGDRIINQLLLHGQARNKIFKILPPVGHSYPPGERMFLEEGCQVNKCQITYDHEEADALIFQNSDVFIQSAAKSRRPEQIWIAYLLESPLNTFDIKFDRSHRGKHEYNWTATYRDDSDLVTPYSKFVPYTDQVRNYQRLKSLKHLQRNISEIRTNYERASSQHKSLINSKKPRVAWMASNCHAANSRLEYAQELSKYVRIDVYGRCGNLICDKWNQTGCLDMINKNYKFYLSFENSNCRQYITEKLYQNAYGHNDLNYLVLPIVMGATKADYENLAPPASFIHADDFKSAEKLAQYLRLLDSDDALYYSYFQWKFVGRFIDTKFMCRVCAMLHHNYLKSSSKKGNRYPNLKKWWNSFDSGHACDAA